MNRSRLCSSSSGAPAAQACGEQEVGYGTGVRELVPGEAAEQLGQPVAEGRGRVDDRLGDPLGLLDDSRSASGPAAQMALSCGQTEPL